MHETQKNAENTLGKTEQHLIVVLFVRPTHSDQTPSGMYKHPNYSH